MGSSSPQTPSASSDKSYEWVGRQWESWWRMFGLRAPLSGDVTQAIDTALIRSVGSQLGFINISEPASNDPALERRIVENVASYGRQLSRLLDAVDVLIRHRGGEPLDAVDQGALAQLQKLHQQISEEKERAESARVDRLVRELQRLARDPHTSRATLDRLRQALEQPQQPKGG
jgi:hypothetical protein